MDTRVTKKVGNLSQILPTFSDIKSEVLSHIGYDKVSELINYVTCCIQMEICGEMVSKTDLGSYSRFVLIHTKHCIDIYIIFTSPNT